MVHNIRFSTAGTEFEVRPITPEDKPLLLEGFERLSDRARYLRFMSPTPNLSKAKLAYLAEVDQRTHIAVGVLHDEAPVAVGRVALLPGSHSDADVAVTVVDDWQGIGIGSELVRLLATAARHRGIRRLHFDVLAENGPMLAVLDRFPVAERRDEGPLVHVVLEAASVPEPASGTAVADLIEKAAAQPTAKIRRSTKTA